MDINEIPRGQLSTIILTTLLDGDRYGYEIIDEIEKKTFGEVVIKKPSLYSSLNRMEKQDLVSSYWKDSEIGGRRHYYRLTDYGKKQVLQWQDELLSSQTKVSKILKNEQENKSTIVSEQNQEQTKPTILQQENLFSLTKSSELTPTVKEEKKQESSKEQDGKSDFIQYDLFGTNNFVSYPDDKTEQTVKSGISGEPTVFNMKAFEPKPQQEEVLNQSVITEEVVKDEIEEVKSPSTVTLKQTIAETQTNTESELSKKLLQVKKSFNFENEYGKYLKSAQSYTQTLQSEQQSKPNPSFSFSSNFETQQNLTHSSPSFAQSFAGSAESQQNINTDNQIETESEENNFTAELPKQKGIYFDERNEEIVKVVNEFEEESENEEDASLYNQTEIEQPHISERIDDAVLITAIPTDDQLPKVKKIAPATFNHGELKNIKSEPRQKVAKVAYEQDVEIDNTYKYEQGNPESTDQTEYIKNYFAAKNIEYKPYNKKLTSKAVKPAPVQPLKTNTKNVIKINKYKMFLSLSMFSLILIESIALIFSLITLNLFAENTLWLYITLNSVTLLYFVFNLIVFLKDKNKLVSKSTLIQSPLWYKLVFVVLALVMVYALHLLGGMTEFNYTNYLTTLLLPLLLLIDYLVFHFVDMFVCNKK